MRRSGMERPCLDCGRTDRRHAGRGLCDHCYYENYKAGTLDRFPRARQRRDPLARPEARPCAACGRPVYCWPSKPAQHHVYCDKRCESAGKRGRAVDALPSDPAAFAARCDRQHRINAAEIRQRYATAAD